MHLAFYRDVIEIKSILRAEGAALDGSIRNINETLENAFVTTALNEIITRLEQYVCIVPEGSDTLENSRGFDWAEI